MNLSDILNEIGNKNEKLVLNDRFKTISYVEKERYENEVGEYVEPQFRHICTTGNSPKFILFSAPGATGKSALALHICYLNNCIYWNLPDNKIAEYSFQGAIQKAAGLHGISTFIDNLNDGKSNLVIDAFDEAEAGSGRQGIEYFLRDLNEVTENCETTCAVLLARTDSAIFIKHYLEENSIPYSHYEIGYFTEENAKLYIRNKLQRNSIRITPVIEECISEQFNEIKRIFDDNAASEFLGYAPVLDALAAAFGEDDNTINILKKTKQGTANRSIMFNIFNHILDREQKKFLQALQSKISDLELDDIGASIYTRTEQLKRLLGIILVDDTTLFCGISGVIPEEFRDEYLDVINTQLPQHPFILSKDNDGSLRYDFTSPAFKDYVIAYALADENTRDFVYDWICDNKYSPSQMLVEFYEALAENNMFGKDTQLMYNSFKAHARIGDDVIMNISGDTEDCFAEFILNRNNTSFISTEFNVLNTENGIHLSQIANCNIDFAGKLIIGNVSDVARINNSVIICDELFWGSDHVLIEAYTPGYCMISASALRNLSGATPRFDIREDRNGNFRVSASNINSYYKLLAYRHEIEVSDADDFRFFSTVVRRVFNSLRCHSKDTPARKMDYVNNRIIGDSQRKKTVLNFLLEKDILFVDDQSWLYKLDINNLSEFAVRWNDVKNGDFSTLNALYNEYRAILV